MNPDPAELEQMRETFLARVPDFGDFRDRPSTYWTSERAYKDEFAQLCRGLLTPELFPTEMLPGAAAQVIQATSRLLTRKLETVNMPQNLIGWRYSEFLRRMNEGERVEFARAFGDLLFGPGKSPERAERFTAVMWPIWQRIHGGNPYALSRNFPTLFLTALDPSHDIPVRSEMFEAAAKTLLGERLLRYAPFSADEYRDVLAFSEAVRRQLEMWAWRPRDMIDVHSFLWVVTRDESAYVPYSGGGTSTTSDIAPESGSVAAEAAD